MVGCVVVAEGFFEVPNAVTHLVYFAMKLFGVGEDKPKPFVRQVVVDGRREDYLVPRPDTKTPARINTSL